jgi:WS/DGAT/MGAT family acyltransferase
MTPVPSWKELEPEQIDLDYHFRHSALPRPGSQRDLGVLVSRLHSAKMDRRYPLWECHLIEGLEGGQWSMYMKVHHSQIDGVGGVRLLKRILSADPDAREMLPPWAIGTRGPDQSGLPARAPDVPERRERGGSPVDGILRDGAKVASSLGRTYAESFAGRADAGRAVPFRAPKTLFNGRIHTPRRFATQHYPIDRLRAAASATGGSLNDVYLTICGGALRRYLIEMDALPSEPMIANVPVSVRGGEGAGVGNAITFLYSTLGTDIADPVERLKAILKSSSESKQIAGTFRDAVPQDFAFVGAPILLQLIMLVYGRSGLADKLPMPMNVTISNVPGPPMPLYCAGAKVTALHPVSIPAHGAALNITVQSYMDALNFGLTADRRAVPDVGKLGDYLVDAANELKKAVVPS